MQKLTKDQIHIIETDQGKLIDFMYFNNLYRRISRGIFLAGSYGTNNFVTWFNVTDKEQIEILESWIQSKLEECLTPEGI